MDADLSREERLTRQRQNFGTVKPFTSSQKVQNLFDDYGLTRDVVADNHQIAIKSYGPNHAATAYLEKLVLPTLASQLHDCLIILMDVLDLSQSLHSVGIPIRWVVIL